MFAQIGDKVVVEYGPMRSYILERGWIMLVSGALAMVALLGFAGWWLLGELGIELKRTSA